MTADQLILLFIHISSAALAFGISIGGLSAAKRARAVSPEAFIAATREVVRRDSITGIAYILTFASGLALIFAVYGGFKGIHVGYHAALGLILLMLAFGFLFIHPRTKHLVDAAEAKDNAKADKLMKLLNMGSGITQLVWVVILVLMIVARRF